jgi:hypothetical protein
VACRLVAFIVQYMEEYTVVVEEPIEIRAG